MAKKKRPIAEVKLTHDLTSLPDNLHVDIPMEMSARQIQMRTDRKEHFRATCAHVGCDMRYAYTGKNPGYCTQHLRWVNNRGKTAVEH